MSMKIWITLLTGDRISFETLPSETIADLKQKIRDKIGISNVEFRLSFHNKPLNKDNLTVSDYGIISESWLELKTNLCTINHTCPDVPSHLTRLEVSQLLDTCISPQTDTITQTHCAKLLSIININADMAKTLILSLFNQSHNNYQKLQVIADLMDTKNGKFKYNCNLWKDLHHTILIKLNPFMDTTLHYTILFNVSKILRILCVDAGILRNESVLNESNTLIQKINFLLMYSGSMDIMQNALECYSSLHGAENDWTQNIIYKITKKIAKQSNNNKETFMIMQQHGAKFQKDVELFDNYMKEIQTQFDTIIHKDVFSIISKYFHCFYPQSESTYHIVSRLINLIDMNSNIEPQWKSLLRRALFLINLLLANFPMSIRIDMVHKNEIILKLRPFLYGNNFKIAHIICMTFGLCVKADKYCLFSYDAFEPIIHVFMVHYRVDGISREVVYILNYIKEIIPKLKLKKLLQKYKFISQICRCIKNEQINEISLDLIEYFLQIKEENIDKLCVDIIVSHHGGMWYLKNSSLPRAKQLCQTISVMTYL